MMGPPIPQAKPPKVPDPEFFDGKNPRLDEWFRQMETKFLVQAATYRDEWIKIMTAYQFIRGGEGGIWAEFHSREFIKYMNGEPLLHGPVPFSWEELKERMKTRFGNRFKQQEAEEKIRNFRQGTDRIQHCLDFLLEQQAEAQLPENQLCRYLLGGINLSLWEMIKFYPYPRNDFQGLSNLLLSAEANFVERRHTEHQRSIQSAGRGNTFKGNTDIYYRNSSIPSHPQQSRPPQNHVVNPTFRPQQQQHQPRARSPDVKPMDISRQKGKQAPRRQCFRCRRFGHFAKDCPVKAVNELSEEAVAAILADHINQLMINEETEEVTQEQGELYPDGPSVAEVEGEDF